MFDLLFMKYLRFLIFAVAATLSALTASADYHSLNIRGQVRARSTNIQLIDADVALVPPGSDDTIKTKAKNIIYSGTRQARSFKETSGFRIEIPKAAPGDYELIVSYPDYETQHLFIDLSDVGSREYDRNIGTIFLEKAQPVRTLNEVTVTASKIKFYNKGDTIVYNADAFNLAEGSMLDELIRQFPGVELKDGGQIYVNGRFVESLMLNGKDFFKGDNLVLLENLGAYTVKDVQVYEKQTDESRFAGRQVNENEYVMDINLKKEYIGGWTFNAEGGYGTENRYLGRFFGLNFDARRRFSLYANANNLNDKRVPGESNSWTPENNPNGLLRHIESGFDYNIETGDDGKSFVAGNAKFTQDRTNLYTVTDNVSFYPSGNMAGRSVSGNINRDMSLKTSHRVTVEKEWFRFLIDPSVTYRHRNSRSRSQALSLNIELPADEVEANMDKVFGGGLGSVDRSRVINATFDDAFSKSHTFDFSTIVSGSIKVPKTSDVVNLFMQYNHRNDAGDNNNGYMIGYGDPSVPSLMRRQHTDNSPNRSHAFIAELSYNYNINDNWSAALVVDQRHDRSSKESAFYMAQTEADATGDFTLGHLEAMREVFDPANSFNSVETSQRFKINPGIYYNRKGKNSAYTYIGIDIPIAYMDRKLDYNRGGTLYPVRDSRWIIRKAELVFNMRRNNNCSLYSVYTVNQDLPTLTRMIDITDTTNPLHTYLGNPDLSTALSHSVRFNFNNYHRDSYSFYTSLSGNFVSDQFIQSRLYDTSTGYTVYRWLNSPTGTYNLHESVYGEVIVGRNKNISIDAGIDASQSKDAIMTGENTTSPTLYTMHNYNYQPSAGIDYNFGKNRIGLSGMVNFRHSTSSRLSSSDINSRDFKYGVKGVFKLPYDFGISTDFNIYQRRGYDSPQLNTSDLVWNMRLSKSFHKGRWMIAVDGFDLLHQLTNVRYSVSPSGRIESYSNTLPRYVLLHAQYKLNIMPKKKELTSKTF